MWGEVTPAERLRSVTRRSAADHTLASAAADALAGFASEPASLVVACRQVLAHHPAHGPLWWVCARILAAAEPRAAAREAASLLDNDRTADRLAAALPLVDEDDVIAAIGWPHAVDVALAERIDLPAIAIRVDGTDTGRELRYRETERSVRAVEMWDAALSHVARLLVPAAAIGPSTALVPAGTNAVIEELGRSVGEVWLIGGVGRVLPARLYDAAVVATDAKHDDAFADVDDARPERLSLERVDRIVGPRGPERVADATARPDCPVVPELLRRPS